jgi:sorting nexin-25
MYRFLYLVFHYRYNIVTEIMQATTVHNLKKSVGLDPDTEVFTFGTGKEDMLQVICYSL